jgi:hypothetical protein
LEALLAREKEKVIVLNTAIDIADQMLEANIRKKVFTRVVEKAKAKTERLGVAGISQLLLGPSSHRGF